MRKIAIFSDICGNYEALNSILIDIDKDSFDDVICLGNLIGIGSDSLKCLRNIMDSKVVYLMGNEEFSFINNLVLDNDNENLFSNLMNELDDNQKLHLKKLPLYSEILEDGHLFSFSSFIICDSNTNGYPFYDLNVLKNPSLIKILKGLNYEYLFCGQSIDRFSFLTDNIYFSCIGSSGCYDNFTFYTILEIDKDIVNVRIKFVNDVKK